MNRITAIALVALTTGCAQDGVTLELEGEIFTAARGVAIADDGERVHMGMDWGTTCAFDVDGTFQQDFDFPTETDAIHDARFGAAVGTSTEGVHFIGRSVSDVALPGVAAAALTEDGAVALTEDTGCAVHFLDAAGQSQPLDLGEACGARELSTLDGLALVGAESGARLVAADGAITELPGTDQIAANRAAGQVYSASTAGSTIFASAADGGLLWQADLGGALVDLADMGAAGLVVASVAHADGGAGVLFLDATTGEPVDEVPVPSALQLATSDNGETLALVGEWETRVYAVERGKGDVSFYTSARDAGLQTQAMGD